MKNFTNIRTPGPSTNSSMKTCEPYTKTRTSAAFIGIVTKGIRRGDTSRPLTCDGEHEAALEKNHMRRFPSWKRATGSSRGVSFSPDSALCLTKSEFPWPSTGRRVLSYARPPDRRREHQKVGGER